METPYAPAEILSLKTVARGRTPFFLRTKILSPASGEAVGAQGETPSERRARVDKAEGLSLGTPNLAGPRTLDSRSLWSVSQTNEKASYTQSLSLSLSLSRAFYSSHKKQRSAVRALNVRAQLACPTLDRIDLGFRRNFERECVSGAVGRRRSRARTLRAAEFPTTLSIVTKSESMETRLRYTSFEKRNAHTDAVVGRRSSPSRIGTCRHARRERFAFRSRLVSTVRFKSDLDDPSFKRLAQVTWLSKTDPIVHSSLDARLRHTLEDHNEILNRSSRLRGAAPSRGA